MTSAIPVNVHQAVARALFDNGVDVMFGLTGDANMYMVNSYVRDCGGLFVAAAHEAGAAMMALGYASLSKKPGICSVTFGPGMTNTVTGIFEGVRGSVPLIIITGDTPVEDRENAQRASPRELATYTNAGFEQVRSAKTVAQDVARVMRRALVERRPMVFSVPMELDWSAVDNYKSIIVRIPNNRAVVATSDDFDSAIGIIAGSRRPVIIAGRGATSSEAKSAIEKLAVRIEAPLATTLKAKDLFAGNEFNLGTSGTVSTNIAVETLLESDCLISFGASLNKYTLSHGTFLRNKRIIQVNVEPEEVGKNIFPDAGIVGDPAGVAELMVHWLDEAEIPPSGYYSEELKQRIAGEVAAVSPLPESGNGTVDFRRALLRLNQVLPQNRVVVTDGGRFLIEVWRHITVEGPQAFLTTINFAAIGLGLPHAIGAAHAMPGRPVVLFIGDGGFVNGGLAEFNTAVRHHTNLIVIVCNDGAYGAEHHKFLAKDLEPDLVVFDWPDFAPVAIALGGEGVTVRSAADWERAERAIHAHTKPLLIDLKVDPTQVMWDR